MGCSLEPPQFDYQSKLMSGLFSARKPVAVVAILNVNLLIWWPARDFKLDISLRSELNVLSNRRLIHSCWCLVAGERISKADLWMLVVQY